MATRLNRASLLAGPAQRVGPCTSCEVWRGPWWTRNRLPAHSLCIGSQVFPQPPKLRDRQGPAPQRVLAPVVPSQPRLLHASAASLLAILPSGPLAGVPKWLLPGSLVDCSFRWILEKFVSIGPITMGLPGVVSLGIFINPMLEAMPRIVKDGHVGKLPLLPYSAMAAQGVVWMFYGGLLGNPAIYTPNTVAMLLGLCYCAVYSRYCPAGADWLPYSKGYHAIGCIATAVYCTVVTLLLPTDSAIVALGLMGNLMTMVMFGGPLAATRTVIKEQSTRSLPFGFTCAVNVNCNLWFFYAYFVLDDPFICLQDGIGLLLSTLQLALFARYGIYKHGRK